ncbi:MAG: hypothetical protein HQL73_09085 [Magnetococcales bacterium]|nr:hypothetical protein [Magnetococcales bacterium]
MIKIYQKENGEMVDAVHHLSPVDAEAMYFRLCRIRTSGPGVVVIDASRAGNAIAGAQYRTDATWRGPREQDIERRHQIWPESLHDPHWIGPTVEQLRGIAIAIHDAGHPAPERHSGRGKPQEGGSGSHMGEIAGVTSRTWRKWIAGESRIPIEAWIRILAAIGMVDEKISYL